MNNRLIYLCDLTHTAHGVVSEFIPYGIGCIQSYFHAHSQFGNDVTVKLIKYPEDIIKSFSGELPGVVGFSNYIWNSDLSHAFARRIKEICPECLIVSGGPNFPLEDTERQKWLIEHSAFDLYITGEGEQPFTQIMDIWLETRNLDDVYEAGIDGCYGLKEGQLIKTGDSMARSEGLDTFPSPYLEGYLDEFLVGTKNIPMVEATRGCPFTCAYCERGTQQWCKITHKSPALFERELDYISRETKASILMWADSNIGMYPQDLEFARAIKRSQERSGYPLQVVGATGKNAQENILKCLDILGDSLPITASVQSLDPEVLKNIRRENVSAEKLIAMAKQARTRDSITRSEIILGLPGDSKEKHFSTIYQLLDAGMDFILPYTLMLLDGSELNTSVFRERYHMDTRFRLSHRCYGTYQFDGKGVHAAEVEEVVVGLDTMTFEDYLDCRTLALTTSIFYSDDILFELMQFLKQFGVTATNLISAIQEERLYRMEESLTKLYESFKAETIQELWVDKDALIALVASGEEGEIAAKVVGHNILFKHRVLAFYEEIENIVRTAFRAARQKLKPEILVLWEDYLEELEKYIILKKRNPFDHKQVYRSEFNFDFIVSEELRFNCLPTRLTTGVFLEFAHSEKQITLLSGFEQNLEGAMRVIPRLSLPKIYRMVKKV